MSKADSTTTVNDCNQIKKECSSEVTTPHITRPCIDFQPDDRWHIESESEDSNGIKSGDLKSEHRSKEIANCDKNDNSKHDDSVNVVYNGDSSEQEHSSKRTKVECIDNSSEDKSADLKSVKSSSDISQDKLEVSSDKKDSISEENGSSQEEEEKSELKKEEEKSELNSSAPTDTGPSNCSSNEDKVHEKLHTSCENELPKPDISAAQTNDNESVNSQNHENTDKVNNNKPEDEKSSKSNDSLSVKEHNAESSTNENSTMDESSSDTQENSSDSHNVKSETKNSTLDSEESTMTKDSTTSDSGKVTDKLDNSESKKTKEEGSGSSILSKSLTDSKNLKEEFGMPKNLTDILESGEYSPVYFRNGEIVIDHSEVIIECPSLLVPLLIKKPDKYPFEIQNNKSTRKKTTQQSNVKKNFSSTIGNFLMGLGLTKAKEIYHRDMKKIKEKQVIKQGFTKELGKEIEEQKEAYLKSKQANAPFKFHLKRCEFCDFKSESELVMASHYLTPHVTPRREFRCNFCSFFTRDVKTIVFHFEALHGKIATLDLPMQYHECPYCPFQSPLKTKVTSHVNKCQKYFVSARNQAPPMDFQMPAITPRPFSRVDIETHKAFMNKSIRTNTTPKVGTSPQPPAIPTRDNAKKRLAAVLNKLTANQNAQLTNQVVISKATPSPGRPPYRPQQPRYQAQMSAGGIQLPPGIVVTRPRVPSQVRQVRPSPRIALPQPRLCHPHNASSRRVAPILDNSTLNPSGKPQISITPATTKVPPYKTQINTRLQGIQPVTLYPSSVRGRAPAHIPGSIRGAGSLSVTVQPPKPAGLIQFPTTRMPRLQGPHQRATIQPHIPKGTGNALSVCEICDASIKDLEELRSHLHWVHKVKIHPKMLVSRPPLNCQKCQWRFFTDQGLERHLLGAHGLVTTNMQDMANKGQDGGRCLICGAVFTYKLVSHMTQIHKVTLKPAHLSYKCTVCTATFNLYRLFESHVYNVHSGAMKRPADDNSTSPSVPPSKKQAISLPPKSESERSIEQQILEIIKEDKETKEEATKEETKEEESKEEEEEETTKEEEIEKCSECEIEVDDLYDHIKEKHMKKCYVKLCRIETCEKCLYSSDEMLVIRMSDFGLDEDFDDDEEDEDEEESESDKEEKEKTEIKIEVDMKERNGAKSDEEEEKILNAVKDEPMDVDIKQTVKLKTDNETSEEENGSEKSSHKGVNESDMPVLKAESKNDPQENDELDASVVSSEIKNKQNDKSFKETDEKMDQSELKLEVKEEKL